MWGSRTPEKQVLVLRDSDRLANLLRQAAQTAPEAERPGLERAAALVEESRAVSEDELAQRWVAQRLAAVGYEGPQDSVAAIKALRQAEPGLSLKDAVRLARGTQ